MNRVLLVGLARGCEAKTTANGFDLFKCEVITSDEYPTRDGESKTREEAHSVVAWGNLAKLRADLQDGTLVSIEGRAQHRTWEGQQGDRVIHEVVASDIQILSVPEKLDRGREHGRPDSLADGLRDEVGDQKGRSDNTLDADDDIPF